MPSAVANIADIDPIAQVCRRYERDVFETLLRDRTTGKNIIWADDEYTALGEGYAPYDEITHSKVADRHFGTVEPRVVKSLDRQAWRTKKKAEVFTPLWLCEQMVDAMDDAFFGNEASLGSGGLTEERMLRLAENRLWQEYVDCRLLEITCGEAPFICMPYDTTTGELVPVECRRGILDRKLAVVSAFTDGEEEWLRWAMRALEATYGYEYQGDNLLIARVNVFNTFTDWMEHALGRRPNGPEARHVARVISWNIWQMDGKTGCAPGERMTKPPELHPQVALFDDTDYINEGIIPQLEIPLYDVPCKIYDWRARRPQTFNSLKG